uniref:Polyketide synthase dehydratase domain-containing protein n=1 Tax=Desertifilum tharense IPPAS B-1220 TaxID=1781255 RepID=A0ACD5GS89_9CYAN
MASRFSPLLLRLNGLPNWYKRTVPEWTVSEVRDLKVLRGLVLHSPVGQRVRFQAKASSHADAESLSVAVALVDELTERPFYQASVLLHPILQPAPLGSAFECSAATALDPQTVYRDYLFHGSCFQLIQSIDRVGPEGIEAWVTPSSPQVWKSSPQHWLFDPGLLDTVPQLAIAWARVQHNTTPSPRAWVQWCAMRYSPLPERLKVVLRVKDYQPHSLVYDADFLDSNGYIRFSLQDVEGTCNPRLNRLASSV